MYTYTWPAALRSMMRRSYSSSSATASRLLQEGDAFCDEALAMMQHVVEHEHDALSQTRHLNNLLLQVRLDGPSPLMLPPTLLNRVLGRHQVHTLTIHHPARPTATSHPTTRSAVQLTTPSRMRIPHHHRHHNHLNPIPTPPCITQPPVASSTAGANTCCAC